MGGGGAGVTPQAIIRRVQIQAYPHQGRLQTSVLSKVLVTRARPDVSWTQTVFRRQCSQAQHYCCLWNLRFSFDYSSCHLFSLINAFVHLFEAAIWFGILFNLTNIIFVFCFAKSQDKKRNISLISQMLFCITVHTSVSQQLQNYYTVMTVHKGVI